MKFKLIFKGSNKQEGEIVVKKRKNETDRNLECYQRLINATIIPITLNIAKLGKTFSSFTFQFIDHKDLAELYEIRIT